MSEVEVSKVPDADVFYYRQRFKNRVFEAVIRRFAKAAKAGMTKRDLAAKLGREPAQVTRWLAGPGNWTLDTVSDLLLALGAELDVSVADADCRANVRGAHPLATTNRPVLVVFRPGASPSTSATGTNAPAQLKRVG